MMKGPGLGLCEPYSIDTSNYNSRHPLILHFQPVLRFPFFLLRCCMQRRLGKGQAHISPPIQHNMGSDTNKPSRLNQRCCGVTNRIWIIIVLFVFIVTLTHYVVPSHNLSHVKNTYSTANLKPINYLNASDDAPPNPFAFCPLNGPGDTLGAKFGASVLSQSRIHVGSGARIQRVITRALAGHPVTISVLGSSGKSIIFTPDLNCN